MWDVVSIPVSLDWGKKRKRRAVRRTLIFIKREEVDAVERRLRNEDVVAVCRFDLVLFLDRSGASGVYTLMTAR